MVAITKHNKCNTVMSFRGGLTSKIKDEIKSVDCRKIEQYFQDKNIYTSFMDDKFVAWGSLKTLQLLENLNKLHRAKFQYPNSIIVRDFEKLNVDGNSQRAFSTIFPMRITKNSDEIIPERTILFNLNNKKKSLDDIDKEADFLFEAKYKPTNFFLDVFFHEFAHLMHIGQIKKKNNTDKLISALEKLNNKEQKKIFQDKFGKKLSSICLYAKESPFEAVACDISKRLTESIDKNTINYYHDNLLKSPYGDKSILTRLFLCRYTKENIPLDEILRRFWNGNFNFD